MIANDERQGYAALYEVVARMSVCVDGIDESRSKKNDAIQGPIYDARQKLFRLSEWSKLYALTY